MSYPQAGPSGPPPQTFTHRPPADKPKRLLGMPIGAIAAIIGALMTLCCICSFAGVFVWRFMPSVVSAAEDPEAKLPAKVTSCEFVRDSSQYGKAEIGFAVINETSSRSNFQITFEVRSESGIAVGEKSEWVLGVEPGETVNRTLSMNLIYSDPKTCHVLRVD